MGRKGRNKNETKKLQQLDNDTSLETKLKYTMLQSDIIETSEHLGVIIPAFVLSQAIKQGVKAKLSTIYLGSFWATLGLQVGFTLYNYAKLQKELEEDTITFKPKETKTTYKATCNQISIS